MRIIYTEDKEENMCETCLNCFATCNPTVCEFGDGFGNDNVIKCSEYNGPYTPLMHVGEIAPKPS